jgi:putative oxidoreductase
MVNQATLAAWTPRLQAVLRIMTGLCFMQHGLIKLFGFPPNAMPGQVPDVMSLMGLAAVMELVGGALFTAGLFTRVVAFLLSGEMAVAYFMAHAPHGFYPASNHGELAVIYCFVFLFFAAAGAGTWSLDCIRCKPSAS